MCGIAGIVSRDRAQGPDAAMLGAMLDAIAHRGPDGEGTHVDGPAALGHKRLAIIDLETGRQPMSNEDGTIWITFNGEIYNYVELRRELQRHHQFRTQSDTEVILHLYEELGERCLERLNGMFAFAIWDTRQQRLFAARDRIGIKPFYWAMTPESLLFASEPKAILATGQVDVQPDAQGLEEYLTFQLCLGERTLFRDVRKLEPGHYLTFRPGRDRAPAEVCYWDYNYELDFQHTEEYFREQLVSILNDSVRLQLRSDVPLGLFLSSGVDSGALLALMSRRSARPVQAFTIDFENGEATNESTDAARIAQRHGAHHRCLTVTADDYAAYFDRYMHDVEEPVGHEAAPAFYFLSKLAGEHVKVALTGQGADEPWAGYGRYVGVRLSTLYARLPVAMTHALAAVAAATPLPVERLKRGVIALGERDVLMRFVKIYSFFSAEMKAELYRDGLKTRLQSAAHAPADCIRALQKEVAHLDPLSQMLYIDTRTNLPDDLLMVGDKTSMANSLEVRVPFLDRRLVEFIESLPPGLKLRGTTGKFLHKKALLKWLPRSDVYRQKKGFANPIGRWLRTSMRPLVDDCLLSGTSMIASHFDPAMVRRIVEADRQGKESYTRQVYLLLSLELWHRAFMR